MRNITQQIKIFMPKPDLIEALTKPPKPKKKSELRKWFDEHYDQYSVNLLKWGYDWEFLAAKLREAGIKDGKGNLPTAKTAQATFYKVHRERKGLKTKRRAVKPKKQVRRDFQRTAG
jgi:hypothetical protein